MKLFSFISTSLLFLFTTLNVSAHALFIETSQQGQEGKLHAITIYYAEPKDQTKELIKDWWSNTAEFSLWLMRPDGTQEELKVNKMNDHFTAEFTPETVGNYLLSIHRTVSSLVKQTQYQFNTAAVVNVGSDNQVLEPLNLPSDQLLMLKAASESKNEISVLISNKGLPLANQAVTVFSPQGDEMEIQTNNKGFAKFEAETSGKYVFETFHKETIKNQKFKDKVNIITTLINVD